MANQRKPSLMETDDDLWNALSRLHIGDQGVHQLFLSRLAAENGWSRSFAMEVFEEYRRFLYLAMRAGHPVSPSDQVDQAWHMHLAHTRDYWDHLCREVLKEPLHHEPADGSAEHLARTMDQYERTLDTYRTVFGSEPPADIWPPVGRRFSETFRRINSTLQLVVPKPVIPREWTLALFTAGVSAAFTTHYLIGPSELQALTGETVHPLTLFFAIFALLVLIMPKTTNSTAKGRDTSG